MSEETPSEETALIARAVLRLARRLRVEMPEPSIGLSALGLLATLHREGPMAAIGLARAERLQPQSLSRMIVALEQQGLIARHRDENDKRITILAITREGRRLLKQDMQARRKWLEKAMQAAISEEERDILLRSSKIMLRIADTPRDDLD